MRTCGAFLFLILLLLSRGAFSATFLPVESPLYQSLAFLEAQGCLKSAILTVKPLSRAEVLRLREEALFSCPRTSAFFEHLRRLSTLFEYSPRLSYLRPLDRLGGELFLTDLDDQRFAKRFYNRAGEAVKDGLNYRFFWETRAEGEKFSFFLRPTWEDTGNGKKFFFPEAYLVVSGKRLSFLYGRLSQWWGPGAGADLILTNNPYPFDLYLVTNEKPAIIGGWLWRFVFFVSRLERHRAVSRPYFWGARLVTKPRPFLEIGLSRSALLGGAGRSSNLKTWLKSFLGKGENVGRGKPSEPGDQRFAVDLKLTAAPFGQPLQAYLEVGREHLVERILYEWAFILGLYLPSCGPWENLSLRLEYTHTPHNWGVHYLYRSGYTYRGWGVGHHLFRKGHDWWGQLIYQVLPLHAELELNFERLKSELTGREARFGLGLRRFTSRGFLEFKGEYFHFRPRMGDEEEGFFAGLSFSFTW